MTTESKRPLPLDETASSAPSAGPAEVHEPTAASPIAELALLIYILPVFILAAGAAFIYAAEVSAREFWLGEISRNIFFILKNIRNVLPYLVLSIAASTWVSLSGFSEKIRAVFERREMIAVSAAAGVGATIPICSCTVIPLIAGLLAGGVPFGPIMAFWISAPLMSPEKFFLTAGVLGPGYAAARLITAVLLGASAGYFVSWLARRGHLRDQLHGEALPGGCCAAGGISSGGGTSCGGAVRSVSPGDYAREAGKMALFLTKWLTLAFFIEALIVHYVDPAWISAALGGDRPFAIPLATAIGIPLYTSGVAAIPIAQGLLASGMAPGAALAFLVAGPVTTVPAMVAVRALVKGRLFAIYLGAGIVGSLVAGYVFQWVAG